MHRINSYLLVIEANTPEPLFPAPATSPEIRNPVTYHINSEIMKNNFNNNVTQSNHPSKAGHLKPQHRLSDTRGLVTQRGSLAL